VYAHTKVSGGEGKPGMRTSNKGEEQETGVDDESTEETDEKWRGLFKTY
jgi:hypothetical protein